MPLRIKKKETLLSLMLLCPDISYDIIQKLRTTCSLDASSRLVPTGARLVTLDCVGGLVNCGPVGIRRLICGPVCATLALHQHWTLPGSCWEPGVKGHLSCSKIPGVLRLMTECVECRFRGNIFKSSLFRWGGVKVNNHLRETRGSTNLSPFLH